MTVFYYKSLLYGHLWHSLTSIAHETSLFIVASFPSVCACPVTDLTNFASELCAYTDGSIGVIGALLLRLKRCRWMEKEEKCCITQA